jgi:hypothetical protein
MYVEGGGAVDAAVPCTKATEVPLMNSTCDVRLKCVLINLLTCFNAQV